MSKCAHGTRAIAIRKWAGPYEIFTTKIKHFKIGEFEHFTKVLCRENLELYGTCTYMHETYVVHLLITSMYTMYNNMLMVKAGRN